MTMMSKTGGMAETRHVLAARSAAMGGRERERGNSWTRTGLSAWVYL
jgi:hypothetical protein